MVFAQRFGGFTNLALAGEEHQNIPSRSLTREIIHCVKDGCFDIFIGRFFFRASESSNLPSPIGTREHLKRSRGVGGEGGRLFLCLVFSFQRTIAHLHRIHAPGHFNHRRRYTPVSKVC